MDKKVVAVIGGLGAAVGIGYLVKRAQAHPPPEEYTCPYCGETFSSQMALNVHIEQEHPQEEYTCPYCGETFSSQAALDAHIDLVHPGPSPEEFVTIDNIGVSNQSPEEDELFKIWADITWYSSDGRALSAPVEWYKDGYKESDNYKSFQSGVTKRVYSPSISFHSQGTHTVGVAILAESMQMNVQVEPKPADGGNGDDKPPYGTLHFTIKDTTVNPYGEGDWDPDRPINGARITIDGADYFTDANGQVSVGPLPTWYKKRQLYQVRFCRPIIWFDNPGYWNCPNFFELKLYKESQDVNFRFHPYGVGEYPG